MARSVFLAECRVGVLAELGRLNLVELKELSKESHKLDRLIEASATVRQFNADMQRRRTALQQLEQDEASLEDRIRLRQDELKLVVDAINGLKSENKKLRKEHKQAKEANSLEALAAVVAVEMAQIDEGTERLMNNFIDSTVPIDDFLDQFQQDRVKFHEMREKQKKLFKKITKRNK